MICAIVLLSGLAPGIGFFALLTILFVAPWLLVQLVLAALRPRRWRDLGTKVAALAATAAVLAAAHAIYAQRAHAAADEARQAVLDFHATHAAWPRTLEEAGLHDADRMRRWRVRYLGDGNLMYSSTFDMFDRWYRAPGDAQWIFHPD